FRPVAKGEDPVADPLVDRELSVLMDSHLICHSDGDGFYVPIDFPEPLYDDRETGSIGPVGSSPQALEGLLQVAPPPEISLKKGVLSDREAERIATEDEKDHPLWIEHRAWLRLFERFRASVAHNAVVTFG